MRRISVALVGATLALSTILVAVPAMAGTSTVSWDFSSGLRLYPGETEIARLAVPDPVGAECTATVEAYNPDSVHPDLDVKVYLNGAPLVSLVGIEDEPGRFSTASAGFTSSGYDELVVYFATPRRNTASSTGSLSVTCEPPPPPGGGEGCTPGYWKQDHHFDSWGATGYEPYDSFDAVFGVSSSFGTLLDGLQAKGGGEKALARHAVAALLNASSPYVSYEYTAAEVIALVQDAYATGGFEYAKDMLEDQNETYCPLN